MKAAPIAACAIIATALCMPARAQQPGLEEIIVTATYRPTNLQHTPIAISAIGGDLLEARNVDNIVQLANVVPNITMNIASGGQGRSNQAFIRGIGQDDPLFTYSPRVSFYIDEVYHATVQGSVFDLLDVERIEVLRGPQGTLFGRNSAGGAFRIFSRQPQGDNSGHLQLGFGSDDYNAVKGSYDLAVIPYVLNVRAAASYRRIDGHVDRIDWGCRYPGLAGNLATNTGGDCKVGTLGGEEVFSGRASARWIINDRIENITTIEYSDDNSEAPPDVLVAPVHFNARNPQSGAPRAEFANTQNGIALWLGGIGRYYYGLTDSPALRDSLYPADRYESYAIFDNPGLWDTRDFRPAPGAPAPRVPRPGDPGAAMANPPINTLETFAVSTVFDWDITDNLNLKSITAWREYDGEFGGSSQSSPFPVVEFYDFVSHEQFQQELQLTAAMFDNRLDLSLGAFYLDTEDFNGGRVAFEGFAVAIPAFCRNLDGTPYLGTPAEPTAPPFFCPATAAGGVSPIVNGLGFPLQQDFQINDPATLENISGFMHAIWHIGDRLNLSAGIRYSHEKKTYTFFRHYYWPTTNATVNNVPSAATESKWTPRIAVDYRWSDDLMTYASFATGFTAGGINGRPFNVATDLFSFDTENVYSYEIGFKSEWLDHRLRINAALYHTDFHNMQLTLVGCSTAPVGCRTSSPFYVDNGGDSRNRGFEIEVEATPLDAWLLRGSVGHNGFKFKSISPQANPPNLLFGWQPSPYGLNLDSPMGSEWTANLYSAWTLSMGSRGSLTPGIDISYRSRRNFDTDTGNPVSAQGGFTLINASLVWRSTDERWSVAFAVNNLTDKVYYTSISDGRTGFGAAVGTVAAPLQWNVHLRRDFQ